MKRFESWSGVRIHTVGHSTRTVAELIALLRAVHVSLVADIRTIPRSRHNPQFNRDPLRKALRSRSVRYVHLAGLGGLRRARADSPNTGWRNASFRGFADYIQSDDFEAALEELRALTAKQRVALMCAEAVPWRCHRTLVADVLTARGAFVEHIIGASRSTPHHLTPFAKVEAGRVTYPREGADRGRLATRAPFHLEATVRVLQRRPENRVEVWEQGRYLRVVANEGRLALVEVENRGTIDEPDVRFSIPSGERSVAARSGLAKTLRKILGLDVDPEPLLRLAEAQPSLRATVLALRGMRPPRFGGWFESFVNVVPFQQLSLDAGVAVVGRLVERFGEHLEHGGRRFSAFPAAEAIAEARLEDLRKCGLSARKSESLRSLARAIESGALTEEKISGLSTDEALRTLSELPGIGPWSAGLVLLRGLGRMDVFPARDVGAARRIVALMRLRSQSSLSRVIERFGDQRGYLYFCALGGSLLSKELIHAAPRPPGRPGSRRGRAASSLLGPR